MESVLIDYKRIQLNEPRGIINYAIEFDRLVTANGKGVKSVKFISGEIESKVARIVLDDLSTIEIEAPKSEEEICKLASLLYAYGKMRRADTEIVYISPGRDISTKHSSVHASPLQRKLDEEIRNYRPQEKEEKTREFYLRCRRMTEKQKRAYDALPDARKKLFNELSSWCDENGKISNSSLIQLLKSLEIEKRKLYMINEEFFEYDLGFDIDWGSVPYTKYIEEVLELEKELRLLKAGKTEEE